ncbi:MAG: TetR/AcrR family transcriptional regulator [Actinomycetota bacterium]|nr:TetR/AcrR family transcriptional regulator [Actinomycetota bacterium]
MSEGVDGFGTGALQRRPPFGDNPDVGTRGAQTQQRILRAALAVFDEVGYHDCGIDRIAAKAECSRPSFYQYFSSKEDLFRLLSGDLARRLFDITSATGRITPDAAGWAALRSFVQAYGDVYDVYAPVFAVFSTAVAVDSVVASGAGRVFRRQASDLLSRVDRRAFQQRRPEVVVSVLLNGLSRAQRFRRVVGGGRVTDVGRSRSDDSLADVMHRSFFGPRPGVNVREHVVAKSGRRSVPATIGRGPDGVTGSLGQAGRITRDRLLDAGREVFAEHGYHDTRVDDIVALADTSHGTFYRYFENKQALFRIIAARSGRRVIDAIDELPGVADQPGRNASGELRRWLSQYFGVYAKEGPIIRAWIEAVWADQELRKASPAQVEVFRRRLAECLSARGFGDVDSDAATLMALLDRSQPVLSATAADEASVVDAFVLVLRRGLFGAR